MSELINLLNQGLTALNQNDLVTSESCFRKVLEKKPTEDMAWYYLGEVYYKARKLTEAIDAFKRSAELQLQHSAKSWVRIGDIMTEVGQKEKSPAFYEKALHYDSNYYPAWRQLGFSHAILNDLENAFECLKKAFKIKDDDEITLMGLGMVSEKKNDLKTAITYYQKFALVAPKNHQAKYMLGCALVKYGKTEDGIESIKQSLALDPNFTQGWKILSSIYKQIGKTTEAAECEEKLRFLLQK